MLLIFTEHGKKLDKNLCKSLLNDLHCNYFGRLNIVLILAYCSWKLYLRWGSIWNRGIILHFYFFCAPFCGLDLREGSFYCKFETHPSLRLENQIFSRIIWNETVAGASLRSSKSNQITTAEKEKVDHNMSSHHGVNRLDTNLFL